MTYTGTPSSGSSTKSSRSRYGARCLGPGQAVRGSGGPLTPALCPQMFKGPDKDIEFIYTAPSTAVCGQPLDTGGKKEYLIAGRCWAGTGGSWGGEDPRPRAPGAAVGSRGAVGDGLSGSVSPGKSEGNGKMHITLCDLVATWDSLSPTQKKSLNQRYQMGCECKVSSRGWEGGDTGLPPVPGRVVTVSAVHRSRAASPSRASSPPRTSVSGQTGRWRRSWAGGRRSTTPASRGATARAPGTAAWPPPSKSFSTSRTPKPNERIPVASRKKPARC